LEASANFRIDRHYLRANFDDWLVSASRLRRWQRQFAALLIPTGIAMLVAGTTTVQILGAAALILSAVELLEFYWYRSKWISGRLSARRMEGESIAMKFDDGGVEIVGPRSQGRITWQGFVGARDSPGGINLQFGDGLSIYVPKSSIDPPDAAATILALAAGGN
jgi:hypothetical protein